MKLLLGGWDDGLGGLFVRKVGGVDMGIDTQSLCIQFRLWQMTEMSALELAPRTSVNAVALGAILPPPGKDSGYLAKIAKERVPLKRHGNAEVVGESVLYLLGQDFLTGTILPIDGGEFL